MAVEGEVLDDLIRRVDEMMAQLASLREELLTIRPPQSASQPRADVLYGSLGRGDPDEYDAALDWERFA